MYIMTDDEKTTREEVKALHRTIRTEAKKAMYGTLRRTFAPTRWERPVSHRAMLLLWGYVRGFKYRRIERTTRVDHTTGRVHNRPDSRELQWAWNAYLPDILEETIQTWLNDPTGAIAAPPARVKKEYVAAPAAAE